MNKAKLWWQTGIIYQIYPRSYQDSNGDGIGDLKGIHQRLDYIESLGVKAIWLSPIFPSPMHDFGYDVADYVGIHPMFGTMADFDALLADVHQRGMKLILDLVPNHSSDEHAWFKESRSSKDNPKRDWYIWRDPAPDGGPPNNWLSFFGGPAWTLDETTGQFYLHQFVTQQPELNYRHPDVLPAMLDNMRFWLDKGVDGFRVDVLWLMLKDEQLRDEPPNPDWDGVDPFGSLQHIHTQHVEGIHDIVRAMRDLLDAYDQRMMVGEIYLPYDQLMTYYGRSHDECHLPFNFQLINAKWNAQTIQQLVEAYEAALPDGAWPNWVLGNHDQHRIASRVGAGQARIANMLLLTLRGTPTTYYGEEIGMENVVIPPEFIQDPPAVNQPEIADIIGRDPERTPMQWDDSANAGFAEDGVQTWLPVADDYQVRNVANEDQGANSMLNLYRALAKLRAEEPALHLGEYESVDTAVSDIFAYKRTAPNGDSFLIVLNFGEQEHTFQFQEIAQKGVVAVSTTGQAGFKVDLNQITLQAHQGLVIHLN